MKNGKINILVVGAGMYVCGRGTDGLGTVLPSIFQSQKIHNNIGKVAVCSTDSKNHPELQGRIQRLSDTLQVNVAVDVYPKSGRDETSYLQALKDNQYDCAVVVVPDQLHCKVAKDLLQNKMHVLIAKPFVPLVEEGQELIETAETNNVYGFVEFHKRFDKANLKIRDEIYAGNIGKPLYCHVDYSQRKCIPEEIFKEWAASTNIFQYLGVHYVDLVHFITGAVPKRVMAIGQKTWLVQKGIDTYDAIEAVIEWDMNGHEFVSTINTNWIDPNETTAMSDQTIKVVCTNGRIDSDQKNRGVQIVTDRSGIEDFNPYFSQFYTNIDGQSKKFDGYGYESFQCFFDDVAALEQGKLTPAELKGLRPTFSSSLVSVKVTEGVNESLKNRNGWVDLTKERVAV